MKTLRANLGWSLVLAVMLAWFAMIPSAGGASTAAKLSEPQRTALRELDETIRQAMASSPPASPSPGLAVALVGRDGAIWANGYGFADLEAERPVTTDTPFMVASVSKTFIAAALMTELEAGHLRLDQDVNELLPFAIDNPRVRGERIEVRHLASHTSGIRDHEKTYDDSYADGDPKIGMDNWLRAYLTPSGALYRKRGNFLNSAPGERYRYSNIGATVGALIAQHTSGLSYRELLRQRIFTPLGMTNTAFNISEFGADVLAVPYAGEPGSFERLEHYGLPTYADGQLRSSVNDLSNYLAMMIAGGRFEGRQVLSEESVVRIGEEIHPNRGESTSTSQAFFWHRRFGGSMLAHSGGDFGMGTFIFYIPKREIGGIVLLNSQNDVTSDIMATCLQALTDAGSSFYTEEPTPE